MAVSALWKSPEVNPVNKKARSIPFFNPVSNVYGRVFFFSWFGFMIAFWSWYGEFAYDIVVHTAYLFFPLPMLRSFGRNFANLGYSISTPACRCYRERSGHETVSSCELEYHCTDSYVSSHGP